MRPAGGGSDAPATHVLVLATLDAQPRRARLGRTRREASPEPPPTPVSTGRATVISAATPLASPAAARRWLADAGESQLTADLSVLNRALHAFALIAADPYLPQVGRGHLLVARVGYGDGEEVAYGRWSEARELLAPRTSQRRAQVLQPQARLAAVMGGREPLLAGETLALRARADLEAGRIREAALQVWVALDATLAELGGDPAADALAERLEELSEQRDAVADAAQAALAGELDQPRRTAVEFTLDRIEAALRARALGGASAPPRS
ncbi:MAG TPA: hypothetical protein VG405_11410 [Solirubrobacteraceae bacterium]|jgi:hypothetical protein|nr:hypothetical protein [Solirubrobacteraceae bacterium]